MQSTLVSFLNVPKWLFDDPSFAHHLEPLFGTHGSKSSILPIEERKSVVRLNHLTAEKSSEVPNTRTPGLVQCAVSFFGKSFAEMGH